MKGKFLLMFLLVIPVVLWGQYVQTAKLLPDGGVNAEDEFGNYVLRRGDRIFAGAFYRDVEVTNSGSVFSIVYTPSTLDFEQELSAGNDAMADDHFGTSFDVYENFLAISAPADDTNGYYEVGSVYLFEYYNNTWNKEQKIVYPYLDDDDQFGWSVAIYGDILAIGAPGYQSYKGAVFIYKNNGSAWQFDTLIQPSDVAFNDEFGKSVSLHANTLVVGSPNYNSSRGKVYVFEYDGNNWTETTQLQADDNLSNSKFGYFLRIKQNIIAVGAPYQNSYTGAVYVFVKTGTSWTQVAKLLPNDAEDGEYFGQSLDIANNLIVVGAWGKSNMQGAAYIFTNSNRSWSQLQKLTANDANSNDRFGFSVSTDGEVIVIGAHYDSDNASYGGAIYIFTPPDVNILQQPQDVQTCAGDTVQFHVEAENAFYYQWKKNGADLTDNEHYQGTKTATLIINNVTQDDQANYNCVVSNINSTTYSNSATLTVYDALQAVILQADTNHCVDTAHLVAQDPAPNSGHWLVIQGYAEFSNDTAPEVNIYSIAPGENIIRWQVSNNACSDYQDIQINYDGIIITTQPTDVYAEIGSEASFLIEVSGIVSAYNWIKIGDTDEIVGYDNLLVFYSVSEDDYGDYYCKIINPCGEFYSDTVSLLPENTLVENNYLQIYPNPTDKNLIVKTTTDNFEISIFNLQGKLIYINQFTKSQANINLEKMPEGIYILKLKTPNAVVIKKIVKN